MYILDIICQMLTGVIMLIEKRGYMPPHPSGPPPDEYKSKQNKKAAINGLF